jgi:hypothetical protein
MKAGGFVGRWGFNGAHQTVSCELETADPVALAVPV